MIVDIVDKLVDKIIQLITIEKVHRKDIFNNFINPIYSDFETVHKNYLESFQKYINMIKDNPFPLNPQHPVFRMIEQDSILTRHYREKLLVLNSEDYTGTAAIFINAIREYFGEADSINTLFRGGAENIPRWVAWNGLLNLTLSANSDEEAKAKAIDVLEQVIVMLQDKYNEVIKEYNRLRQKYLK